MTALTVIQVEITFDKKKSKILHELMVIHQFLL